MRESLATRSHDRSQEMENVHHRQDPLGKYFLKHCAHSASPLPSYEQIVVSIITLCWTRLDVQTSEALVGHNLRVIFMYLNQLLGNKPILTGMGGIYKT